MHRNDRDRMVAERRDKLMDTLWSQPGNSFILWINCQSERDRAAAAADAVAYIARRKGAPAMLSYHRHALIRHLRRAGLGMYHAIHRPAVDHRREMRLRSFDAAARAQLAVDLEGDQVNSVIDAGDPARPLGTNPRPTWRQGFGPVDAAHS